MVVSQPDQYPLCPVDVQPCTLLVHARALSTQTRTQQLRFVWEELGKSAHLPPTFPHHRLHHGGSLSKHLQRLPVARQVFEMLVRIEVCVDLPHPSPLLVWCFAELLQVGVLRLMGPAVSSYPSCRYKQESSI